MKEIKQLVKLAILSSGFLLLSISVSDAKPIPTPDHVVVVIMENHSYSNIIGSSAAPYINSLAHNNHGANFSHSHALTHPSQPNYIMLFSGSSQGVKNDGLPRDAPFSTENLGAELIAHGKTFGAYSEDLPAPGYLGASYHYYARKHDPWVNWIGAKSFSIPSGVHKPFTSFPTKYNRLPTVSFVIPNLNDDMHNGHNPATIIRGDNWLKNHLGSYVTWAKTHSSLLIVTWDEDDDSRGNQIPTIFVGQMVKGGTYNETINHYSVLRTILGMYRLPS
ncbi:MAG: alkaline phosphatase family protein, partial [Abditibacteriaceae bacterium]